MVLGAGWELVFAGVCYNMWFRWVACRFLLFWWWWVVFVWGVWGVVGVLVGGLMFAGVVLVACFRFPG